MPIPLKILVVGCGHMGASHAKAYHNIKDFKIVGLVSRHPQSREYLNSQLDNKYRLFSEYNQALKTTKPDVVSINTYPETHAEYTLKAFEAGAHVFLEKPVAPTLTECKKVIDAAKKYNKKLVVGYILQHHSSWLEFLKITKTLGKPLVIRMNINQQSSGSLWKKHRALLNSVSPIVDCGVHYINLMCRMTKAKPISVSAIAAKLTDCIPKDMYNYGHLQIRFDDGSVGWFESGWGPMISKTAFFIKDVIGPNGSVSLLANNFYKRSDTETEKNIILQHHSKLNNNDEFILNDKKIQLPENPTHEELCKTEQVFLLNAIRNNTDLTEHMNSALNSLKIVLAADKSIKTGKTITL